MRLIILLSTCFFNMFFIANAQNLFNKEHSIKFVNYLFNTKQYKYASIEMENLVYLNKSDDSLKYLLLKAYRISNQYDKGIIRTRQMYENMENIPGNAGLEFARMLIMSEDFNEANKFIVSNKNLSEDNKFSLNIHISLLQKNWNEANNLFISNKDKHLSVIKYQSLVEEGVNLKHKSPALAVTFSTLLPGSGKIYTGLWKDGLFSLLSIGVTSWQAYKGFKTDGIKSTYGWFFVGISTIVYSYNIYGTHKSAKLYNIKHENKIIQKVKNIFDSNL